MDTCIWFLTTEMIVTLKCLVKFLVLLIYWLQDANRRTVYAFITCKVTRSYLK